MFVTNTKIEHKVADNKTWDGILHTDAKAVVVKHRAVVDVMAIRVDKASIRLATVSGWFEVADVPNPFRIIDGNLKVEVKCYWKGLKPPTEWIHLTIPNKYQFVRRFSGEVAEDMA